MTNSQLYKKAYLVEFYGGDENTPEDVFTFSIPPESEELTYSQRKTETKTFGGLHIDDYGVDAVKISLSGSTINQSIKRIYKGGFGKDEWLSGEDEIYHFRDLILKYKNLDFLRENKNAKILVYDLSKFAGFRTKDIENYWQAFPGEFKIRRASDRPYTYKYTFEFTGIPFKLFNDARERITPMGSDTLAKLQSVLEGIKTALDFASDVEAWADDAISYVNQVNGLMNILGNAMTQISTANIRIGIEIQNTAKRVLNSVTALNKNCLDICINSSKIPQEVLDQHAMYNEEFKDFILLNLNQAENAANELAAYVKSSNIPDIMYGNINPVTGKPMIILSYGHTSLMIKDTDSLESLAAKYLGDPDRAIDIAAYNNITSLNNLSPGDIIKIPITTRTIRMINNLIFARREDRDNYGRDILLTDAGFITASNTGDYALARGVKNLSQAVLLRLRESSAKRIRINTYGIRKSISDQTAGKAYISSSVRMTVNNDPRVAAVDDIQFKAAGDVLSVNVSYHDINNAEGRSAGRI